MPIIDTEDLKLWSSKPESSIQMAELICKLVRGTATHIKKMSVGVGKGVWRSGWDGILEHAGETEFIPDGISLWEWGTGPAMEKAEKDFKERTDDPLGQEIENSTFVFVTPHVWSGKAEWIKDKISKGSKWKNIRVYDGESLVQWLMRSPVSSYWLAKQIRSVPSEGFSLPLEFWDAWSKKKDAEIPIELIMTGREFQVAQVQDLLEALPSIIAVQASARDEAIAFMIASILQLGTSRREDYLSRTLIVEDEKALRQLIYNKDRLILVIRFPERDLLNQAVSLGHHILLPLGADDGYKHKKIELPRLNRVGFTNALLSMGYQEEEAQRLSRETGRSITVLRRREGFDLNDPKWLREKGIEDLIPVLLAGKWDESKEGDRAVLEKLAGKPYQTFVDNLQLLQHIPDAPFKRIGTQWRLVSPLDAWSFLSSSCSSHHFALLRDVVLETLLEVDPALEMGLEVRHLAALNKKVLSHSHWIRQGLLQSLILISLYGDRFNMSTGIPCEQWVDSIVEELLRNAERKLYRTLNDVVTELAEASPEAFMSGLGRGLDTDSNEVLSIFEEGHDPLLGAHYHSGYLWALESIAWDRRYLGRACVLLTRLAVIDPGGRLSNRPAKSLLQIFIPWKPQTMANAKERGQVFSMLADKFPEKTWDLGLSLIGRIQVQFPAHPFRWRPWDFSTDDVEDPKDVVDFLDLVVGKLIDIAGVNGSRIGGLLRSADDAIIPGINSRLIIHILAVVQDVKEGRLDLWKHIRSSLYYERFYPPARWTIPHSELPLLDSIYELLNPPSKVDANLWVFQESRPEFPDGYGGIRGDDLSPEIKRRRLSALKEMYSEVGIDGLMGLIPKVTQTGYYGASLAEGIQKEDEYLNVLRLLNSSDRAEEYVVRGYITQMNIDFGLVWAKDQMSILKGLGFDDRALGKFLVALPFNRQTWILAESFGENVDAMYWALVDPVFWRMDSEDVQYAADKLIQAGRYRTILQTANERLKDLTTVSIFTILDCAGSSETQTTYLQPSDVVEAFTVLDERTDLDKQDFLRLELKYTNVIVNGNERGTARIHEEFCKDPSFFMQAVELVSKDDDGNSTNSLGSLTEEEYRLLVTAWYEILYHWNRVPGMGKDGTLDTVYLKAWVDQVLELGRKLNRKMFVAHYIGKIMYYVPMEPDGMPAPVVCDLLESLQSTRANQGFESEWINHRGPTFRDPFSGGFLERDEASRFTSISERLALRWPYVAALFSHFAKSMVAQGSRIDAEASRMDHDY